MREREGEVSMNKVWRAGGSNDTYMQAMKPHSPKHDSDNMKPSKKKAEMRGPEIRIKNNNSKQRKRRKESKGGPPGRENQKTKTKVKTNKKKRDIFTEQVKNKTDQPQYILCATHHQLTS